MFYNLKISFFLILYFISLILYYFIDKQLVLVKMIDKLENPFIGALIIWGGIVVISAIIVLVFHFILKKIINLFLKLFKKEQITNNGFLVWLNFTLAAYAVAFIIFAVSIRY